MRKKPVRWLCLVLVLLMLAPLAACGAKNMPDPTPPPTPEPTPAPTPEPTPEPTPMPTVQTIDIHYAGTKVEDFTMKVGETVPLTVYVLPENLPIEAVWSTDADGQSAFEFNVSESDPAACELVCVGPLPADSGGVNIYVQVYGGKAQCRVHVVGTEAAAREQKTVEIYYPLEDKKLTNFTMRVGESIQLEALPLNEQTEDTVKWSMDDAAARALRFIEDKTDPNKITLECLQALPAGTGGVTIFAELDGVKNGCIVYVK